MQGLGRRLEVQCFAGGFYGIQFCVQPVPGQGGMKVRKFPFNLDASFAAQTKHFINYLHGDDLIQRPAFGGPGIRHMPPLAAAGEAPRHWPSICRPWSKLSRETAA